MNIMRASRRSRRRKAGRGKSITNHSHRNSANASRPRKLLKNKSSEVYSRMSRRSPGRGHGASNYRGDRGGRGHVRQTGGRERYHQRTQPNKILNLIKGIRRDNQNLRRGIQEMKDGIENQIKGLGRITNVYENNDFFSKLCVKQSERSYFGRDESTWSLCKIIDEDNTIKCVGISAAHLLLKHRHSIGTNYFFIELPESFCKVGVEEVRIHSRLFDTKSAKKRDVDLIMVVLSGIPMVESYQLATFTSLHLYPQYTKDYDPVWRNCYVRGRSSVDFVSGRCVIQQVSTKGRYYTFMADSGESGDSGTLLYAVNPNPYLNENDSRELLGVFIGTKSQPRFNPICYIMPAIGSRELTRKGAVKNFVGQIDISVRKARNDNGDTTYMEERFFVEPFIKSAAGTYTLTYDDPFGVRTSTEKLHGTIIEVPPGVDLSIEERHNCDGPMDIDEHGK